MDHRPGTRTRHHRGRSRHRPPKPPGSTPWCGDRSRTAERAKTCTPGYYNREGQADAKTRQGSFFFGEPTEYADILETLARRRDDFDGLETYADEARGTSSAGCGPRSRRRRPPRVAIIGAGFGGLATAVALRRAGIDDLVIIEGADGVGGTWRRNTYPGAACDIQSHLYSFSFAPNTSWSRTYARQPEILAYLESVADDFDLRRHLRLGTAVAHRPLERRHRRGGTFGWTVRGRPTDADRRRRGQRRRPVRVDEASRYRRPDRFRRRADAHRAMGSRRRPDGQKVAVIGTGASGVQAVPELAERAAHVTVFQRTPPWMVPKDDRPYSATELARFRRNPLAVRRTRWQIWKFQHDYTATMADDPLVTARSRLATAFLERTVADPDLRRALTPDYPFRCKRVLLGDDYYRALQQDHVELVTDPIDRITETSIRTATGEVVDADAIVLATGFETSDYLSGIEVVGVGRADVCTSAGVPTPAPTWAWRSADSRTSSCSTAPTPTRAATRSSTSSRPAPGWWPAP